MRSPQFFAALEADTNELLRDLADGWTPGEIASIRGDIQCGEWGLAIEQVAGGLVRLNKPLTAELLDRIDDLARRTNTSESTCLLDLHARARQLGIRRRRRASAAGHPASPVRFGPR